MWKSILAISLGAAFGALLRWVLGAKLNSLFPTIPPGTLAANLIGAYLVGLAIAFFNESAASSFFFFFWAKAPPAKNNTSVSSVMVLFI